MAPRFQPFGFAKLSCSSPLSRLLYTAQLASYYSRPKGSKKLKKKTTHPFKAHLHSQDYYSQRSLPLTRAGQKEPKSLKITPPIKAHPTLKITTTQRHSLPGFYRSQEPKSLNKIHPSSESLSPPSRLLLTAQQHSPCLFLKQVTRTKKLKQR